MVSLPRFVVAAPASGQGKTTIATGLMAALRRTGLEVSGHKVGPDYIDPGYHALATGRPGRNLDPHLCGVERMAPLLLHGARGADVAVVEGVMGLYDGRIGGVGFASTAHLAELTASPVVLVVDISHTSRSIGAVVHGMATYDPAVRIAGVILNKAASARHADEAAASIDLPVLGVIGRDAALATPSRHLGLVPAAEREEADRDLGVLAGRIAEAIDLAALMRIARSAPDLDATPWDPRADLGAEAVARGTTSALKPVVAVASGRAFTFHYAETEELLRAAGCEPVRFDPLTDRALPEGTAGIYLGGGFPEMHAQELTGNASLRAEVATAVAAGMPTVAECAGLLYLTSSVDGSTMVGAIDAVAEMTKRLTLRYPVAVAASDSLLTRAGEEVNGHEFHRTQVVPRSPRPSGHPTIELSPAWVVDGEQVGFASASLHASYLHTHWAGHPELAERFADAVHAFHTTTAADPLRHHGDAEVTPGLLDLAVNVYDDPPPAWLRSALSSSLDEVGRYPDVGVATVAVARHHGRDHGEVLATAGAAEAFTLVARLREWRHPVVVHPQFTEPHAALAQAGRTVTEVRLRAGDGFRLEPTDIPEQADLVVLGNPTNPTGALHPAGSIKELLRPGRLVVVDEAFMDAVPYEGESLAGHVDPGLLVVRSLTKHWGIPGVRAGYILGDPAVVRALGRGQVPWSVGASAIAALVACSTDQARAEAGHRAEQIIAWRAELEAGLDGLGIHRITSAAPFVLAQVGPGVHEALRTAGIAVRRADTFPGLDGTWVRIAVRSPEVTARLVAALARVVRC